MDTSNSNKMPLPIELILEVMEVSSKASLMTFRLVSRDWKDMVDMHLRTQTAYKQLRQTTKEIKIHKAISRLHFTIHPNSAALSRKSTFVKRRGELIAMNDFSCKGDSLFQTPVESMQLLLRASGGPLVKTVTNTPFVTIESFCQAIEEEDIHDAIEDLRFGAKYKYSDLKYYASGGVFHLSLDIDRARRYFRCH